MVLRINRGDVESWSRHDALQDVATMVGVSSHTMDRIESHVSPQVDAAANVIDVLTRAYADHKEGSRSAPHRTTEKLWAHDAAGR